MTKQPTATKRETKIIKACRHIGDTIYEFDTWLFATERIQEVTPRVISSVKVTDDEIVFYDADDDDICSLSDLDNRELDYVFFSFSDAHIKKEVKFWEKEMKEVDKGNIFKRRGSDYKYKQEY